VARIWRLPEPRGRPRRRPELRLACSVCAAVCTPLFPATSLGLSPPKLQASGVGVASPPWPAAAGGGDGVGDVDGEEGEKWYPFAASCASVMEMSALNRPWPDSWPPATAMPSLPSMLNLKGSSRLELACWVKISFSWFGLLLWLAEEGGQEQTPILVWIWLCVRLLPGTSKQQPVVRVLYQSHQG